jgi:hypothetical protein
VGVFVPTHLSFHGDSVQSIITNLARFCVVDTALQHSTTKFKYTTLHSQQPIDHLDFLSHLLLAAHPLFGGCGHSSNTVSSPSSVNVTSACVGSSNSTVYSPGYSTVSPLSLTLARFPNVSFNSASLVSHPAISLILAYETSVLRGNGAGPTSPLRNASATKSDVRFPVFVTATGIDGTTQVSGYVAVQFPSSEAIE